MKKIIISLTLFFVSLLVAPRSANASELNGRWELFDVLCLSSERVCESSIATQTLEISQTPLKMCVETTFKDGHGAPLSCLTPYQKGSRDEFEKMELQLSEDGRSIYVTQTNQFERRRTVRQLSYVLNRQQNESMHIYETIRYYSYSSEFKQWRESFKPWRKEYYFRR